MTDHPKPYDPRPEWMQEFHKETSKGSDTFGKNVFIDIDKQLEYDKKHGRTNKAPQVLQAMEAGNPFMLYADGKRFCVIIPKLSAIVTYYPGDIITIEMNPDHFQNRLKQCYVIYPNFETPSKKLLSLVLVTIMKQCKIEPVKQLPANNNIPPL